MTTSFALMLQRALKHSERGADEKFLRLLFERWSIEGLPFDSTLIQGVNDEDATMMAELKGRYTKWRKQKEIAEKKIAETVYHMTTPRRA